MRFANRPFRRRGGPRAALPPLVTGVDRIEALCLPVRLSLLDHIRRSGPSTPTEAGAAVGLTPAAASYHLRVLAHNGFLEETGDETDGRKRRWRARTEALTVDPTAAGTPDEAAALDRLEAAYFEHASQVFARYIERRDDFPDSWRQAASSVQQSLILTPREVASLRADLLKLLQRYGRRRTEATGDATAVFLAFNAVPQEPPPGRRAGRHRPAAAAASRQSTTKEVIS